MFSKIEPTLITPNFGPAVGFLTNGGSPDLNVDGSVTPVVFEFAADATDDIEATSISLIIEDGNIKFGDRFLGNGALGTGILVETRVNGTGSILTNLQRTRDVASLSSPGGFDLIAGTPVDYARSIRELAPGFIIRKQGTFATNDFIRATIRDDLTNIDLLRILVTGVKR